MTGTAQSGLVWRLTDLAGRTPRVLLVDDAPRVRLVVSACLRARGFEVMEAATESAAIAIVEARGHEIDLVFADVSAGGCIEGLRLLESLLVKLPSVPLVLTSRDAKTAQAARKLCQHATIVTKPYCIDDLSDCLGALVA